ncbi:MAG: hypothetical protein ABIY70_07695 [Capsulimonas sp.]|uniref:hypothetical protein n=1 Tax=Capsulimonas sp. TaxID=2494211 RepID=UPI003267001F
MNKRSTLAALLAAIAVAGAQGCANAGSLSGPYIDPDQFTKVPFGSQSHWAQPWRSYGPTVPASTFVNGTGAVFNVIYENPDMIAKMLASHGIHHARVEIGWGLMSYDDETKIIPAQEKKVLANLTAFKKYGIRPLILLNAHQAGPCPYKLTQQVLAADAHTGDMTVQLKDTSGLKVGYSGLSNIVGYVMGEQLITKIDGNTLTLAKPVPKDLTAGATVQVATLKYRPFSKPDTDDYKETVAGWQKYVESVTKIVSDALGTTDAKDKGFDLEVWNELTFGGKYLSINNYYPDKPSKYQDYNERSIYTNLVKATADVAEDHTSEFSGVQIGDGFANTMPWSASSEEPARVAAIDKHPYPPRRSYPKNNPRGNNLNAKYEIDPYVPTYDALFPEYNATSIQTENIVRDMGPITNNVGKTAHGRLSRTVNGTVKPTTVWITETNVSAGVDNPSVSNETALLVKAKTTLRFYSFFLNKGVSKVDLYAAMSNNRKLGDKELGIVQANFVELALKKDAEYPADDSSYTAPALAATSRMVAKMNNGLDPSLTKTHPISLISISDTHDHAQFKGDGTSEHPDLYDRDVFAFLPFQVNSHRFVIPYYVMTRDVMKPLDPEKFTLTLDGFSGKKASITVYDPISDKTVPFTLESAGGQAAKITVTAADYPYLLIIDDPTLK